MQIQDESKRNQARVTLKPGGAVLASLCALCLWAIAQAADTFVLVKEKSRIEFVGSKPGGWHRGGFKQFSVDGSADWSDLSRSSVRIEIDATSLWSDEGGLTRHLQAADFFDVSRYPKIEFETTQISLTTPQDAVVTGKHHDARQERRSRASLQDRSDRCRPDRQIRIHDRPHAMGDDPRPRPGQRRSRHYGETGPGSLSFDAPGD